MEKYPEHGQQEPKQRGREVPDWRLTDRIKHSHDVLGRQFLLDIDLVVELLHQKWVVKHGHVNYLDGHGLTGFIIEPLVDLPKGPLPKEPLLRPRVV